MSEQAEAMQFLINKIKKKARLQSQCHYMRELAKGTLRSIMHQTGIELEDLLELIK